MLEGIKEAVYGEGGGDDFVEEENLVVAVVKVIVPFFMFLPQIVNNL